MKNSIEDIIADSLFYIESLNCAACGDVDFYINNKLPHCDSCKGVLSVTYEDIKPVGLLDKRAPIKRLSGKVG